MRKNLFSLVVVAGLALAVASSAFTAVVDSVRETTLRLRDFILDGVLAVVKPFGRAADWRDLVQPAVQLVQACAYALKLAKRERPNVHPSWRMCPSI